jgi:hypothetical protein
MTFSSTEFIQKCHVRSSQNDFAPSHNLLPLPILWQVTRFLWHLWQATRFLWHVTVTTKVGSNWNKLVGVVVSLETSLPKVQNHWIDLFQGLSVVVKGVEDKANALLGMHWASADNFWMWMEPCGTPLPKACPWAPSQNVLLSP